MRRRCERDGEGAQLDQRFAKPPVRINRRTGEIVFGAGSNTFSGTCERSAEPVEARKF